MKTLGTKGLKLLKVLHILCNFIWIGGGLSMMFTVIGFL